jgi:hypothetical protein
MALAHCILGKFLGVDSHCFPSPLDVSTFSARCLHVQRRERPLAEEGGTLRGREMFQQISSRIRLPRNSKDLLHAANLRHGTDGFTSPHMVYVIKKSGRLVLTFVGPCIVIYFYCKTNQMHNISNLFYFKTTLYMFQAVSPSIIRSRRLYIQH